MTTFQFRCKTETLPIRRETTNNQSEINQSNFSIELLVLFLTNFAQSINFMVNEIIQTKDHCLFQPKAYSIKLDKEHFCVKGVHMHI